ncbi:toll/interleukin-1 receptor domain-containing protein [Streptomyces sp. NPDC001339]|uniref:toll/interleukin-1 receptor domain-containing protein n=1 Tax=Streptomyces sp. NPDC001339 TaxID=3364563 RepID=UPI0036AF54FB
MSTRAAWLLACGLSWLLCRPFFGPLGGLVGIPVATLVFSPLAETVGQLRQRPAGAGRLGWRWRRLLRPESVVWLLSAVGCVVLAIPFVPALPAPYGTVLVGTAAVLGCGSSAAQALVCQEGTGTRRRVPDLRLPLRGVVLWALAAAGVLGGAAWAVQRWTVPFVRGEFVPEGRTAVVGELLGWLDRQVSAGLFGPSFAQWYWPLLVAMVALVIGGGCAALREWPARRARLRDPFAGTPEGEGPPQLRDTARVFLSYSRADADFATRYVRALGRHVREVWVDWQGIKASEKWRRKIFDALRASDAVIVLVSRNSLRSEWCWRECEEAIELGKRILPVLISPEPTGSATAALQAAGWGPLAEYQRLTMADAADFDRGVRETLAFVAQEHVWVDLHTRFGEQAHAWRASGFSEGLLLRPHEVRIAEAWRAHTPHTPGFRARRTAAHDEFIDRSRSAGRLRARRWGLGAVAVVSVLGVLTGLVLTGQADAERQRRTALSQRLAAAADAQPYPGLVRTSLLGAAAYAQADTYEARDAMAAQLMRVNQAVAVLATGLRRIETTAFSRDGRVFAATFADGRTRIWDTEDWRPRGSVPGRLPDDARRGLSGDGRRVVVGRGDRIEVRDTGSLLVVDAFPTAGRPSSSGVWSGGLAEDGGRVVAAAAGSPATLVRDVTHRRDLARYTCAEPAPSPRGTRVWCNDPDAGRLREATGRSLDVRVTRDFHAGAGDSVLYGWTVDDKPVIDDHHDLKVTGPGGNDVWVPDRRTMPSAVSEDGRRALLTPTGTNRGDDDVWDLTNRRKLGPVSFEELRKAGLYRDYGATEWESRIPAMVAGAPRHGMRLAALGGVQPMSHTGVVHSPDGRRAVTLNDRGELMGWRLDGHGRIVSQLPAPLATVSANALSPDGRTLAVLHGTDQGQLGAMQHGTELTLVGSADGRRRRTVPLTGTGWSVAYSPDGSHIAVAQTAGTGVATPVGPELRTFVEIFASTTARRTATLRSTVRPNPKEAPGTLAFSPDGRQLYLAFSQESTVERWRLADGRSVRTYGSVRENGYLDSVVLSPDGRTLAAADRQSRVRLWDTATGRPRPGAKDGTLVTFSPDGRTLATVAGSSTSVQLWDARTGARLGPAFDVGEPSTTAVQNLRITPDGTHLLVITQPLAEFNTSSLWLWDLRQRKRVGPRLAKLDGRAEPQITPDGTRAVLAGAGVLVSVDLDPAHWQSSLCRQADRRLTTAEWRAAAPGERYPVSCSRP